MVVPRTDRTIVIHLTTRDGFHTAYVFGRSRNPRSIVRDRLEVVHVPHEPADDLSAVLEAVAAALVLPPSERWQPRP